MVFRTQGVESGQLVEHRSTPLSRWLRARRLRIAAWIALGEGVLVLIHAVPRIPAMILAAAIVLVYFAFGRHVRVDSLRQVSWIAAASQTLMILVPVLAALIGGLAIIALVALAVVALFVLLQDRR
ncbi:MAG: hypothetical protein E6G22_09005 [Actinobacteria bacterium]|nr:MAG: hypothetical protein E6G22_09005 [Actinomycetota bacterium]